MSVQKARELAKAAAANIRPFAPVVADAIERGAWRGELRAYRPHFAAMAALGAAISMWPTPNDGVTTPTPVETVK